MVILSLYYDFSLRYRIVHLPAAVSPSDIDHYAFAERDVALQKWIYADTNKKDTVVALDSLWYLPILSSNIIDFPIL
jgi:hypothetical protein